MMFVELVIKWICLIVYLNVSLVYLDEMNIV